MADTWFATVETYGRSRYVGIITRPWPEESNRLGRQRVRCKHHGHRTYDLALRCAERLAESRREAENGAVGG